MKAAPLRPRVCHPLLTCSPLPSSPLHRAPTIPPRGSPIAPAPPRQQLPSIPRPAGRDSTPKLRTGLLRRSRSGAGVPPLPPAPVQAGAAGAGREVRPPPVPRPLLSFPPGPCLPVAGSGAESCEGAAGPGRAPLTPRCRRRRRPGWAGGAGPGAAPPRAGSARLAARPPSHPHAPPGPRRVSRFWGSRLAAPPVPPRSSRSSASGSGGRLQHPGLRLHPGLCPSRAAPSRHPPAARGRHSPRGVPTACHGTGWTPSLLPGIPAERFS